ncbi:MAG TPA: DapH/DapD/GlmU-related protein [Solirubrobacterales bacterium]|nr:DapH/DapD/GlmU-related protein [Solirubrobacterales bacterium]
MSSVHPTAVVETDSLGADISVGEFAIVREGAVLGDGVTIGPHSIVESGVEVGAGTEVLAGTLLGRRPRAVGAVARVPTYGERILIGPGCVIGPHAIVYYDVEIGAEVLVADGASIRELCSVAQGVVIGRGVTLDREVRIGRGTRVMDKAHLTGGMEIGEGVFISTMVATTNDSTFGREYVEHVVKGPTIESGAMIGGGASLLPGVRIGRDAVVGSGAVVTADVEPGTTVMGVPARPVQPRA